MNVSSADLLPLLPVWILIAGGVLLLMYEVFATQADRTFIATLGALILGAALYATLSDLGEPTRYLFGNRASAPLILDAFAVGSSAVIISGALVATLLSPGYAKNAGHAFGEYYALIIFSVVGMMVMVMAGDLITFFLGLETMSVAVYCLAALRTNDVRSAEAAMKYFLMGAFATGFLLFGIALIYGTTHGPDGAGGSVALADLARSVSSHNALRDRPLQSLGIVMVMVGFAFKVAAVPFHMWAPDVYEGAPTPISGFMAVGVKAAAFLSLLRLVVMGLAPGEATSPVWIPMLSGLAMLTILAGNVLALVQRSIKRMLAYSSVAHAGYAMIGVVAAAKGESSAGVAVLYYLAGYTFMTLGAFGVLAYLERKEGGPEAERFGAYAGIGFKHPALGIAMVLFMIALAGLPPTGGFFGKLYLFSAALRADELALALVGITGSVLSIFYYLRVVVAFYMRDVPEPGPTPSATPSAHLTLGLALCAGMVLVLGVLPSRFVELTKLAVAALGS